LGALGLGYALSIVSASVARHVTIANHLGHGAATVLLLAINFVAFGIAWTIKFLIFNRMFRISPPVPLMPTMDRV
jgi:hypothetical protein